MNECFIISKQSYVLLKPELSVPTIGKQFLLLLILVDAYFCGIFLQKTTAKIFCFAVFLCDMGESVLVYWVCLVSLSLYIKTSFSLGVHTLTLSNFFINPKCFRGFWKHLTLVYQIFLEIKHVKLKWPLKAANAHIWAKHYGSCSAFSKQIEVKKIAMFFCNKVKGRISKRVFQENKARQILRKNKHFSGGKKCSFLRKIWRALFSWNIRFKIRPFALLSTSCHFQLYKHHINFKLTPTN